MNTKEFIEKAIVVHNNKYNYEMVNYTKSRIKLVIICPFHGEFLQIAYNHLSGQQCPKCTGKVKLTNEEFIRKSIKTHGNLYN